MHNWWRWVLRSLAVAALVVGGVLLFIQPIANKNLRIYGSVVTLSCSTPFQHLQGKSVTASEPTTYSGHSPYILECQSAASDREHIIEALGVGVVILVGLSFLRHRRPTASVPLEAAPV